MFECRNDLFCALHPDTRPENRKVKAGRTVFGNPLAAP
jgi:hypothetical protein